MMTIGVYSLLPEGGGLAAALEQAFPEHQVEHIYLAEKSDQKKTAATLLEAILPDVRRLAKESDVVVLSSDIPADVAQALKRHIPIPIVTVSTRSAGDGLASLVTSRLNRLVHDLESDEVPEG